ncbi:MAG: right-handed parallel beta-helix repeat-containing protein [Candidatus Krumholzibacteriota bacterium]|nr:right-handed parallel beta-helix repeat-containing protein [Candidatus Krumholzibacteriota bacterium]
MFKDYKWLFILVCILVALVSIKCTREDGVISLPDVSAPSYVADLEVLYTSIASATLTLTAPGDDENQGTAAKYDVRYSALPITDENWDSAVPAKDEPSPNAAGTTETVIVRDLEPDVEYFFAVKTADEMDNWSGISNSDGAKTVLYHKGEGTWQVPCDAGTIQEAIDAAAAGDTVLVECGRYYEHDIHMKSGIVLLSRTGEADCAIIDAGRAGRVLYCQNVDETAVIKGFTLTNGNLELMMNGAGLYCSSSSPEIVNCAFTHNEGTGHGGGLQCIFQASPKIVNCTFADNDVQGHGAGISCMYESCPRIEGCAFTCNDTRCHGGAISIITGSAAEVIDCVFTANSAMGEGGAISCTSGASPTITGCTFESNSTQGMGGAIGCSSEATPELSYCLFINNVSNHGAAMSFSSSSPLITNCTFAHNIANLGSVLLSDASQARVRNSIIAHNTGSTVVLQEGDAPLFYCTDIYGNSGGDWTGCIAFQSGLEGNFSANPLFCGEGDPDDLYGISESSPCAPDYNPICGLVGALPVSCTGSF